jgi:DNA-binding transcriptional LysR family regulator
MLKLESAAAFVAIADAGSISDAARRLQVSKSVVSERLAELERALGTRLINRTTRSLALTDDGTAFYARARRILQEVEEAATEIVERRGELSGRMRISAPVSFGSLHVSKAIMSFLQRHPKIELTLELDDRFVNLSADGYDAVIRHGPAPDGDVIAKRLAPSRRVLVASPDYIKQHGKPQSIADLDAHRGIIYSNRGAADWRFKASRGMVHANPQLALRVNNGILMRDAAIAGLGIALLPTFFVYQDLRKGGALRALDVGAEPEGAMVHMVYPNDRRISTKVRALTQWLRDAFGTPPYWDARTPSA